VSAGVPAAARHEPELAGQTVVVDGSAGTGLETAWRARAEGAEVILTSRGPAQRRLLEPEIVSVQARDALSDHIVPGIEVARNARAECGRQASARSTT